MNPIRRRKKRPNYGIKTVEVMRGPNGFGFTISGQQPCILSCIVNNSPADQAGLRAGDFLISVNNVSVSKIAHDAVVNLIGTCISPIKMTIAENYYSDSSDEDLDHGRMVNSRKPKYMHKPRGHRLYKAEARSLGAETNVSKMRECIAKHNDIRMNSNLFKEAQEESSNVSNHLMEDEAGPIEYKALVGYLGTIEMPKELLPNSRLQTVCSCIRKLRQEKRTPTAVLMTILPTCLTLKNASNHILAIYPTNRVVYIGSTTDKESRYFGLVTSAVCDTRNNESLHKRFGEVNVWQHEEKKLNNVDNGIAISNSCHVFVTDPKIVDHNIHVKKADSFKINCTTDVIMGHCLEFPRNSLHIVSLVQNMYKLQNNESVMTNRIEDLNVAPVVANSPQPSASSNSDSGIGFRDDCGNVSDRILVVEFPVHRPLNPVVLNNSNRPTGIDGSNNFEILDGPLNNDQLNNVRCQNMVLERPNNLSKPEGSNLNNIRACNSVNIKNHIDKNDSYLVKQNNDGENNVDYNRAPCRALLGQNIKNNRCISPASITSSDDNTRTADVDTGIIYRERPIDIPDLSPSKQSYESISCMQSKAEFKNSVDNISTNSLKSMEFSNIIHVFKTPSVKLFENRKCKRQLKMASSCDGLDKCDERVINYKLSSKMTKTNHSCEELNNLDFVEKNGYGSLQDLCTWANGSKSWKYIVHSEPDVRINWNVNEMCEQNEVAKCNNADGPSGWATSFEKLLEDPLGLHTFADFLKKEFSAENIYFWTACERFRRLPLDSERTIEARRIYQQHLSVGAAEPVNVDSQGKKYTENCLQNPDSSVFDFAQKQIFNLMKFDSYPRFLKSDIYKQCLSGDIENVQLDTGLLLQVTPSTPSKLKKSLSNAEDRRRKSILPWHRKNRSKSKDRGENEYQSQKKEYLASKESLNREFEQNNIYSSKSSLTSLDLAITQETSKSKSQEEEANRGRKALCRVILSNGSTTVVQIKDSETVRELIERLMEKRGITYSSYEVYTNKHTKPVDINDSSTKLSGCEVTVEQRVVFKLDLPNRKIISVKSKYTKLIVDVLRPILHRYHYNLDQVHVTYPKRLGDAQDTAAFFKLDDLQVPVTVIDNLRLNIQLKNDIKDCPLNPVIKVDHCQDKKLEEITNQELTNKVFEGILQEKSVSASTRPCKSDRGSVKSEDWGSEHSSGIIGRLLRRDSTFHERKKKTALSRSKGNSNNSSAEELPHEQPSMQVKKPIIAKMKQGANRLNVSSCENDELLEGLTKLQSRLEDQRGTAINCELPDFLKDKENDERNHKAFRREPTKFYNSESTLKSDRVLAVASAKNLKLELQSNYENLNITSSSSNDPVNVSSVFHAKINNMRFSPSNFIADDSLNPNTPNKRVDVTVIENRLGNGKNSDPPPLPPKPATIPIKPPNWGQDRFGYKPKNLTSDRYLEQPSSSFV